MLHEVLLALSGHPSPLFQDNSSSKDGQAAQELPLLSPSEKALLRSIGELSELHRKLRQHVEHIASDHASTICRAVATSIQQVHLVRFQDKILAVESNILTKDSSLVGAYDIVPLAGVVAEFEEWQRRMAWYWEMACFMQPADNPPSASNGCTGAALINRLRAEQLTGYPAVEEGASALSRVAEMAWLRQLASWILYWKVPAFGAGDFFIQSSKSDGEGGANFWKDKNLLPNFVMAQTAASILFIGKSLHQVRKYGRQATNPTSTTTPVVSELDLVGTHLKILSELPLPIVPAQLSRAITAIRLSLSQKLLKSLLPVEMTMQRLSCLKQFFLLDRGEFAVALIDEVETRLQARQQSMGRLLQQDPVKALQGLSIKNAEFDQALSQTWKTLVARNDDIEDEVLDFARKHVTLSPPERPHSRPPTSDSVSSVAPALSTVAFNDLLFPSAVQLGLQVTPPLDLFISQSDVDTYSAIHSYLLSLKRAHLRLSNLWRRTAARREYSTSKAAGGAVDSTNVRERHRKRRTTTRKIWATCSAAVFLISEVAAYLEGEIVKESWDHFEGWVKQPTEIDVSESSVAHMSEASPNNAFQRDPETLAAGHRAFLAALTYALLLDDVPYTKELRSLLGNVDNLIAFFNRLLDIQQKLDVEHDAGGETDYTTEEEHRISLELDRARKKVDSDLKSVVNRLRQLDQERIGSGRYLNVGIVEGGFEPWKGGGVDRLLMKLEFGRMTDDDIDLV